MHVLFCMILYACICVRIFVRMIMYVGMYVQLRMYLCMVMHVLLYDYFCIKRLSMVMFDYPCIYVCIYVWVHMIMYVYVW